MTIRSSLMNHQLKMVEFALEKEYFAWFASYGLGKTLTALAYIEVKKFKKVLVVSTKTALESTWVDEIRTHTDFQYAPLLGTSQKKLVGLELGLRRVQNNSGGGQYQVRKQVPVVFLVNYDGVENIHHELMRANFDFILLDESIRIKSPSAIRTMVLWKIAETIKYRGIMVGWPISESLSELYAQIKFLDKGKTFGTSYFKFLHEYFAKYGYKHIPKKKKVKELLAKIRPFCIRITSDVIKLPPKVYKEIKLEQTAQQKILLEKFNNEFRLEFGKVKIDTTFVFTLLNKSLQICDGFVQSGEEGNMNREVIETAKDEALLELIEEIDIRQNKVLIWTAFRFSAKKISFYLKKLGLKVLSLTGETEDVNGVVQKFQKTKDWNILVATQKKAAESITLTACRYAVYYSKGWSGELRSNSEARTHRKGSEQHDSVIYTDLITKGTVEEKVHTCLRNKKNLVEELQAAFLNVVKAKG